MERTVECKKRRIGIFRRNDAMESYEVIGTMRATMEKRRVNADAKGVTSRPNKSASPVGTLRPVEPSAQVTRPLHQLLVLVLLHLQLPLPLDRDEQHRDTLRARCSPSNHSAWLTHALQRFVMLRLEVQLLPSAHTLEEWLLYA